MADFGAVSRLALGAYASVALLLFVSVPAMSSDMPAMPGSYWEAVLMLLYVGMPFSLVLLPALVLLPGFLIRSIVLSARPHAIANYPAQYAKSRKWRIWTIVSLLPWGLVGLWILYDLATNRSI